MFWRIQIQADDIMKLFFEPWVVGNLERLGAVRLEIVLSPDAMYDRSRNSQMFRQGSHTPVSRGFGLFLRCRLQNLCGHRLRRLATAPRSILFNSRNSLAGKPRSPVPDETRVRSQFRGDGIVLDSVGGSQNHFRPSDKFHGCVPTTNLFGQGLPLLFGQFDCHCYSHQYPP